MSYIEFIDDERGYKNGLLIICTDLLWILEEIKQPAYRVLHCAEGIKALISWSQSQGSPKNSFSKECSKCCPSKKSGYNK